MTKGIFVDPLHIHQYHIEECKNNLPAFLKIDKLRFDFPECVEKRSWQMIANFYKDYSDFFSTGDLGPLADENYKTWACFQWHPCLVKLGGLSAKDAMCYVYNENDNTWFPWGLKSEISHLKC